MKSVPSACGMAPTSEPGVVWLGGVWINGPDGSETLVAHYSRRKGLEEELEQGLMHFDDKAGVFKKIDTFEASNAWRHPRGNALRVSGADGDYVYFIAAFAQDARQGGVEELR